MSVKIIETEDRSHSLYSEVYNENYHSIHGSINESKHIFINSALSQVNKNSISILEIGFGTGLNALLALEFARSNKIQTSYTAIEKHPLNESIYKKLNYSNLLSLKEDDFIKLHEAKWNSSINITSSFSLLKLESDLRSVNYSHTYDVVFFDAFSPEIQPELWTLEIFNNIFEHLNQGGILTTYSAKGEVKRTLRKIGFEVEHIPGPKGKRVITRAIKKC